MEQHVAGDLSHHHNDRGRHRPCLQIIEPPLIYDFQDVDSLVGRVVREVLLVPSREQGNIENGKES